MKLHSFRLLVMLAKIDQNEPLLIFSLSSSLRTLAFHSLCFDQSLHFQTLSMASRSSGRNNSASKGFDFATNDDFVCSYEDYGNQDNYTGRHYDSVIGSNSVKVMAGILALSTMFSLASLLTEATVLVPALYVFGDSIVDGGNTQPAPPYGIDLNTTIPIRWSNGKTVADFIASFLGLPFVPPSTSTSGVKISKTGVNYGYSGCGLLRETVKTVNCSFEDQIGQFNITVANDLTKAFNPQDLVQHLTSSVFLVSFGQNDYNFNYLSSGVVSKMAPEEFAKILLNEMSTGLKTLYRLGARKFVVKNIWPLGCLPNFVNQSDPRAVSCNETINQLVVPYSNSLPIMLNDLQSYLIGAAFSHSNEFQFVADLMENPRKYGITNTTGYCYDYEKPNTICKDRDQYLHFDFFHPTQAANYFFSLNCFDGTLCSPLNIRTLIGA